VHLWHGHPHIIGGRDAEAEGTWMAMSRSGKISMVTNYRDPFNIDPKAPSRGKLVSDYLVNGDLPEDYVKQVTARQKAYNGFNLVVGTVNELFYLSNYGSGSEKLAPGLYGLSNHLLNTPWPKVVKGKEKMSQLLQQNEINTQELFSALRDEQPAEDAQLPDTGVGLERERVLSSMFIKSPGYGTRSSTVVKISNDNHVSYAERVYDLNTFDFTSRTFEFTVR
jgi:uncharacterized protein with NRDE domain